MFDITPAVDKLQQMVTGFIAQVPNILAALIVFAIFYIAAGLLRSGVKRFSLRADLPPTAQVVLGRLIHAAMVLIGLLVAAPIIFPGFTAAEVVSFLGIGGVAIGFAFRDILQNFLAGILLFLTQPFKIGDQIIVGEYEGTVNDILTRATLITTYDGRRVVIPNADLFTQSVIVNTAYPSRRSQYDFGIGYGDDVTTAKQVILEAIAAVDEVLDTPAPEAFVVELAGSSLNIRARWWTASQRGDVVHRQAAVVEAVARALQAAGIDMPFPTQQVLFHDQTEETDGDRSRQREGWPVRPGETPPRPRRIVDALATLAGSQSD